jgi:hypothetical protein
MTFELADEETEALPKESDDLVDSDLFQFSARIRMPSAGPSQPECGPPLSGSVRMTSWTSNSGSTAAHKSRRSPFG